MSFTIVLQEYSAVLFMFCVISPHTDICAVLLKVCVFDVQREYNLSENFSSDREKTEV
jgi:hypothetical protein